MANILNRLCTKMNVVCLLFFCFLVILTAAFAFWDLAPAYEEVCYPTTRTMAKQNRYGIEHRRLKSALQEQATTSVASEQSTTMPGSSEGLDTTTVEPEDWEQKLTDYCRSMVSDELCERMGEMKLHAPTPAEFADKTKMPPMTNKLLEEFVFSDWPKDEQERFMDTCKQRINSCLSSKH